MAAPSIDEIQMPNLISRGAQGGPGFRTVVVGTSGGQEQRVQQWADPRAEWTISLDQRDTAGFTALLAFWYARSGRARGFRFKDWSDYVATNEPLYPATQSPLNPVKGSATAQLVRSYGDAANVYIRNIYKPLSASPAVTLRKNGSNLPYSSIDTTTGLVTLNAVSTQSITGISATNPAVVSFAIAPVFALNDLVVITGVAGMVQINGTVAAVTVVGGTSITLGAVNASTFSAWTSGGTATKYLATTDALDWSGQYDIPARFDSDQPGFSLEDVAIRSMTSIRLIELKG
jgi:uncharacterized protein (TIGR02217 family)